MERFVARENIRRFKEQLASCVDPAKRSTLERLLAAEKARLSELNQGNAHLGDDEGNEGANDQS